MFIIISDFEEEQIEDIVRKKEKQAQELVEVEQLATFSSETVERGFFWSRSWFFWHTCYNTYQISL